MERYCCICGENIHGCFGYVKAGDFLEYIMGERTKEDIREFCARCVENDNAEAYCEGVNNV